VQEGGGDAPQDGRLRRPQGLRGRGKRHPFFLAAFFLAAHIDFARCLASSRWAGVHFFLAFFAAVVVGTGSACFFPAAGCAFLDPGGRPRLFTPAPKA